jgi:hypothetical protein
VPALHCTRGDDKAHATKRANPDSAFPENASLTWARFPAEKRIPLFLKML